MSEQKPCPFCGEHEQGRWIDGAGIQSIRCGACGAHGPEVNASWDIAWKEWDKRGDGERDKAKTAEIIDGIRENGL